MDMDFKDDDLDIIFEEVLIKEKIKMNNNPWANWDEFGFVADNFNQLRYEQQLNEILNAIRLNRQLKDICLSLEAFLLERKRNMAKEIKELMTHGTCIPVREEGSNPKGFYLRFSFPYFKDEFCFYCPGNEDVNKKLPEKFIGSLDEKDRLLEIDALSTALKEYIIQDYVKKSNLENLKTLLLSTKCKKEQSQLTKEVYSIQEKINSMRRDKLQNIAKSVSESEIDWEKISWMESLGSLSASDCFRYWKHFLSPDVYRGTWNQEEERELKKIAAECQYQDWDKIAYLLNTKRTAYDCFVQFKKLIAAKDFNSGPWSKSEDNYLRYLVSSNLGETISWGKVLYHLEDRSAAQVINRWYRLQPGLRKGKFTAEEDTVLEMAVGQFGLNFSKVAALFPDRCALQLRERYFAKKAKQVNKSGEWSLSEDRLLMDLVSVHGEKQWSKIASHLPLRNRTQIRHRYKSIKDHFQNHPKCKLGKIVSLPKKQKMDQSTSEESAIDFKKS